MRNQTLFPPVIPLDAHDKASAHQEAQRYARMGMSGIWVIQELHSDHCLAADSQRDRDCKCTPDFVLMRYDAHADFLRFDARMRKVRYN